MVPSSSTFSFFLLISSLTSQGKTLLRNYWYYDNSGRMSSHESSKTGVCESTATVQGLTSPSIHNILSVWTCNNCAKLNTILHASESFHDASPYSKESNVVKFNVIKKLHGYSKYPRHHAKGAVMKLATPSLQKLTHFCKHLRNPVHGILASAMQSSYIQELVYREKYELICTDKTLVTTLSRWRQQHSIKHWKCYLVTTDNFRQLVFFFYVMTFTVGID